MRAVDSKLFVIGADLGRHAPDDYRRNVPAMRGFDGMTFRKPVTFFVGENGSGKSTIIEALAVAAGFNEEGGSKNFRFETVRREDQSEMPSFLHLTRSPRVPPPTVTSFAPNPSLTSSRRSTASASQEAMAAFPSTRSHTAKPSSRCCSIVF